MNRFTTVLACLTAVMTMAFSGCGSSDEATNRQEQESPSTTQGTKSGDPSTGEQSKVADTMNVNVQNTQKPTYEQPAAGYGKFAVQVGAYKMQDNAERVAALARERFGKNVYTIPDRLSDLYKVMVGDFTVKDEARRFRDEMVQRFPSDYKDAWVSELPAK
jgi:cell division septation protein DedD